MPRITALLHTHNDAFRLGRALDSLRPCDEVLVIDDRSEDDTSKVAREHGATLKSAVPGVTFGAYATDALHDWFSASVPMRHSPTIWKQLCSTGRARSPLRT